MVDGLLRRLLFAPSESPPAAGSGTLLFDPGALLPHDPGFASRCVGSLARHSEPADLLESYSSGLFGTRLETRRLDAT